MITSSGPKCDVCGHYILPLNPEERVNFFTVERIPDRELHCDNKCRKIIEELPTGEGNWKFLPEGPLRKAFEDHERQSKEDNEASQAGSSG